MGQAAWNRGKGRAGERGAARAGKPRCARIWTITWGSTMAAMIFKCPPQRGQRSMPISNTRLSKHAQLMRAGASGGRGLSVVIAGPWNASGHAGNDLRP